MWFGYVLRILVSIFRRKTVKLRNVVKPYDVCVCFELNAKWHVSFKWSCRVKFSVCCWFYVSVAVTIRNGNSYFIEYAANNLFALKFIMPYVSQLIAINSLPETTCFSLFIPSNHSVYIARVEEKNRNGLNALRTASLVRGLHTRVN